ncbi:hypothetical protein HW35_07380 [Bacillus sp. X1(2014)]|nr:hypothetical protein HW35_07380 [Bacillus sp. X1(2014)]
MNIEEKFFDQTSNGIVPNDLLLLYSHPFNKKSYLLKTKEKQIEHEVLIEENGLFYIDENSNNKNIILWSNLGNSLFEIEQDGYKQNKVEIGQPLNFIVKEKDIEILSLNTSTTENSILINIRGEQFKLIFKPLIINATHDEQYIYLFGDIIEEERSVVYVISKSSKQVIKEIPIKQNHASDMLIFNNNLVISTEKRLTIIEKESFNVDYIDINNKLLSFDQLHTYHNKLFVSYYDKGYTGLVILDENFKVLKYKTFNFPYMRAKFNGTYLYVMSQVTTSYNKTGHGIIGVFNIEKFKKIGQLKTPEKEHKLQDFFILKKGDN